MEHRTKTLDHSLAVLSHPLTVLAFLLYLANTFFLQTVFPSWWTGKIGDFAWLYFFPLVLCVPLSLLISQTHPARQTKVIYLAIALCGIPFALLKTFNLLLNFVTATVRTWPGIALDLTADPSDLIALTSLLGAAWLWKSHRPTKAVSRKFAYALMAASVVFTLADSALPDKGIYYLESRADYLLACSTYGKYQSQDGGMNWQLIESSYHDECEVENGSETVVDPFNKNVQYKYGEVGEIFRSENAGSTWVLDYSWKPRSDAGAIYLQMKNQMNYYYNYPLSAAHEPKSGNVVFAMGSEGVLVRQPNGQYSWRAVDHYKRMEVEPLNVLRELIWGEVYLGLLLGCLCVSLVALKIYKAKLLGFLVYFSLFVWLVNATVIPPAILRTSNYNAIVSLLGLTMISILSFPLLGGSLLAAGQHGRNILFRMLLLLGIISLTFPIPYALWALGIHNSYIFAFLLALFLEITITVYFFRTMRRDFPDILGTAGSKEISHP